MPLFVKQAVPMAEIMVTIITVTTVNSDVINVFDSALMWIYKVLTLNVSKYLQIIV